MAVILDHNYGCLMTMLKYGSIQAGFWSQIAYGVSGNIVPMPYMINYKMIPENGDAITLQAAENQTFDGDGVLTDVTP